MTIVHPSGNLVLCGGSDFDPEADTFYPDCHRLNWGTGAWETFPSLPQGLDFHAMVSNQNKTLMLGGHQGYQNYKPAAMYENGSWTEISSWLWASDG